MGGGNCALLVNNVPVNMKDDCITALFNIYGEIVALHSDEEKSDDLKNKTKYCLVIFSRKNEALRALEELHEIPPLKFDISTYPPSESRGVGKPASVLKEAVIKKEFSVHAAITSKNLPQPLLSTGVVYNVLSVTRFDSPSSMVVRLDVSSGCSQRIVNELNNCEPAKIPPEWQLCPGDLIAARNKGTWMRGIVLERLTTGELSIYLPDSGHQISSSEKEIGLVVSAIDKFPACALQVSLAGVIPADNASCWNQAAINISWDFLKNDSKFLKIRIHGYLESGRLAVDILKEKGGDLKSKLLIGKLALPKQETYQQEPLQQIKYEAYDQHEISASPVPNKIERSNILSEEDCHVLGVTSLDNIFIMRASKVPLFEDVTAKLVDVQDELKLPKVGFRCVAKDGDLAFRVDVVSVEDKFKFKVNFIDQGFEKVVDKRELYVLKGQLKDLEPMAEVVSLETAENVDRNDAKILEEARKYLVDDNKKFVCSVLRNGRVILKDGINDNVIQMIIKSIQDGSMVPIQGTKKPDDMVTNELKPAKGMTVNKTTAKPVATSVQNRLSSSHRIQTTHGETMPAKRDIVAPKENMDIVQKNVTTSKDAKVPETVNESGDNQWKSKNVRFQSASKTVSQEMSAPTAAANTEVEKALDVNTEVKAVQPQIPEPFVGTVVHAESINCFFVHRTSNDALYDEIQEDISRSAEVLNVVAAGTVCAVDHVNSEGNPAFFRGRIEKMKKDGSMVKVFLMDEGITITCSSSNLYKLERGRRYDYEQLPGLLIKCSLGPPDSKWLESVNKMFVELLNENRTELTVKPLEVADGVFLVDLEDSEGSYVELMIMCESETTTVIDTAETKEDTTADKIEEVIVENVTVTEEKVGDATGADEKKENVSVIEKIVQQPMVQKEPVVITKVLPGPFKCVVTWINGMEDFYVTKEETDSMDYFELLETLITEVNEGRSTQLKSAKVGQICLIEVEDIFYRAVIKSVDGNNVEVLAIDEGRQVNLPVTSLLSLAKFEDLPGLAIHVGLTDLTEQVKSQLENFKQIISIDERVTFLARPEKFDGDKLSINLFEITEDGELNILEYFE